jgi:fumarate reductase flavoprotein subunit
MRLSRFTADPELSWVYCNESGQVVDWLTDHGVPANVQPFVLNFETTVPRAHWTGSSGKPFAEALIKAVNEKGSQIKVYYQTPGKKLVVDKGRVTGVIAEDKSGNSIQFKAKAVVLSTGGFPQNHTMLTQYHFAHSEGIPGAPGCTGDGINMAAELGAVLKDMEWGMNY